MRPLRFLTILITLFFFRPIVASEPPQHYGTVFDGFREFHVEGGLTATVQSSSDGRLKNEALTSFDLVAIIPMGQGEWLTYIEGNLSPRTNGISGLLAEVNGDAGSALDRNDNGRLQISELYYSHPIENNNIIAGLINPAGILDASDVANDETAQFLGSSFVNNPTIAFPDYTLGTSLHIEEGNALPGFNLLLASSHGLADNPDRSYPELFDVNASGKGLFVGSEMYWTFTNSVWRLGIWVNTADHPELSGPGLQESNNGVYLTTDHTFGHTKLNLRLGMANEDVAEAARFIGLALETPMASQTLGIGLAKTGVSKNAGNNRDDTIQAEVYVRFDPLDNLSITPSIQYIENSGFDYSASIFDKQVTVYTVRASYNF